MRIEVPDSLIVDGPKTKEEKELLFTYYATINMFHRDELRQCWYVDHSERVEE